MSTITYESNVPLWTKEQVMEWSKNLNGKKESIPDEVWKYYVEVNLPALEKSIDRLCEIVASMGSTDN